jgi:alpha-beta hydrolase superfamily lysophospholipase
MILASCGLWLPDAVPLSALADLSNRGTVRVAAVYVADPAGPYLTQWVLSNPDIPVQTAPLRIPITLPPAVSATLPMRVEAGLSYLPMVLTAQLTVASNDSNRLIRVIGHVRSPAPAIVLADRSDPRIAIGFEPPWLADTAPVRLRDGAALLIEGVRAGDVLLPLVIAPVIDE